MPSITYKLNEKVCLINPPLNMEDRFWYPIGIATIASYLRKEGIRVEVIDIIGENLSRDDFIERLKKTDAQIFGIGGLITAFNEVVWIADTIRKVQNSAFIFAGNSVAYTIPEILLNNSEIDVVVMGEGEITSVELINSINSFKNVKGIVYKNENDEIVKTPSQKPIENLDDIPFPAWDLIPMQSYFGNLGQKMYPISTVRGCPYSCTFYCKTFMGYTVRARSAQSIIEELLEVKRRFNIGYIYFFDDLFIYDKKRVLEFCKLKNTYNALRDLQWEASARVNLIDEELVKAMKGAGCVQLGFGFESADQAVLDGYNKKATVEQAQGAIDLCHKYNIDLSASSFMVGAINETSDSMKKGYDFCRKNKLRYEPHFVTPFPLTPLYDYALKKGIIEDELEYIKGISKQGNTNYLFLNLTHLTDEELIETRNKYIYFPPDSIQLKIKRGINIMKTAGTKNFLKKTKVYILRKLMKKQKIEEKYSNIWN